MSQSYCVLLLEDEVDNAHLAKVMFAEVLPFVELHHVEDGMLALQFLRREAPFVNAPRPQLILSDLFMPHMDGLQFLQYIKADELLSDIPVLMFSSTAHAATITRCYQCGAAGYLVKPGDINRYSQLLQSIANYWFDAVCLPRLGD